MDANIAVVLVAAACMIVVGVLIFEEKGPEQEPEVVGSGSEFFEWPKVTGSGGLEIVEMGDGTVVFDASPIDSGWGFQHWMGPGGELDNVTPKVFTIDETGGWTAVFGEAA